MSGKRAKELRRLARQMVGKNAPERHYVRWKSGSKVVSIRLHEECARYVYQRLKKEHRRCGN